MCPPRPEPASGELDPVDRASDFGIVPVDPALDALVRIAAALCDAPVAMVTLVDAGRQVFHAVIGHDAGSTAPLHRGWCPLVAAANEVLVIPDALADAQHRFNEAVTIGGFRFYVGVPLPLPTPLSSPSSGDGPAGTLCVLDRQPRPGGIGPERLDLLRTLAGQVAGHVALRRTLAERDRLLAEQRRATEQRENLGRARVALAAVAGDGERFGAVLVALLVAAVPDAIGVGYATVHADRLRFRAVHGLSARWFEGALPLRDDPIGRGLVAGRPFIAATADLGGSPADAGAVAVVAPVRDGAAIVGVLVARLDRSDAGAAEHVRAAVEPVADTATAALTEFRAATAHARLAENEARYRALFDAIDDGFCIIEFRDGPHGPLSDYVHVEANNGYERHTGIAGIVGRSVRDLVPASADQWVRLYGGVLATGRPIRFEREFAEVNRQIEVSASRIEPPERRLVSVLFRDVTARKRAEAALHALNDTLEQRVAARTAELLRAEELLRQSQKMEAVGQLTGGIAHDFNNLLTGIAGSLELLGTRIGQNRLAGLDRYVAAAQDAARRAASLTHRLLAFSRRQTLDPKPTDVNRLVDGLAELIRRTAGPAIAVHTGPAPALWATLVDASQLENALLNLCINARDAMPNGGTLRVETANRAFDAAEAAERDLLPGDYVSLSVTDDGVGMPADVVAQAFDPFFTTKPLGAGTGLGLSMIYGFARQSGGGVRIRSTPGTGTRVSLFLPRHRGALAAADARSTGTTVPRTGRGETVLVVDDEPILRMLVVEVLEELGYAAIEASDGAGGLRVLQSDVHIDLLVTDVGLPGGMNGRQMADAARVARPDLRVLFITGYAETAAIGDGLLEPGMHVMTKPFALDALATRIRDLITVRT